MNLNAQTSVQVLFSDIHSRKVIETMRENVQLYGNIFWFVRKCFEQISETKLGVSSSGLQ